jgi:cephalosporin hydroxylase
MLDNIYGPYEKFRLKDRYEKLWSKLAPVWEDEDKTKWKVAHNGLTQRKNEIIELWQLFDRIHPMIILEIGVAQGGTFAGWCQLADDNALIIGIDRDVNDCLPRKGELCNPDIADPCDVMTCEGGGMYRLKRKGSQQKIVAIKGWTYEPETMQKLLDALQGRKIEFLFHDASHQEQESRDDFELFWPLVSPGGVYAMHDIAYYEGKADKWKFWREIVQNGPHVASYEYRYHDRQKSSMGIGVLFKEI